MFLIKVKVLNQLKLGQKQEELEVIMHLITNNYNVLDKGKGRVHNEKN